VTNGFVVASYDEVKLRPELSTKIQLALQGQARSLTICCDVNALAQVLPHVGALL